MGFWHSELGEVTGNKDEAFAKSFNIIPNNTMALCKIDSFVNANYQGIDYLNIEWSILEGDFKGQKVNQKIKVFDNDLKIRHRALNMLKLIYKLFNISPKHDNNPTDQDLYQFVGKKAGLQIRETEETEKYKASNWVSEVHDAKGFQSETGVKLVSKKSQDNNLYDNDLYDNAFSRNSKHVHDDDIPF